MIRKICNKKFLMLAACFVFIQICAFLSMEQLGKTKDNFWAYLSYGGMIGTILFFDLTWIVMKLSQKRRLKLQEELTEHEWQEQLEEKWKSERNRRKNTLEDMRKRMLEELSHMRKAAGLLGEEYDPLMVKSIMEEVRTPMEQQYCENPIGDAVLIEKDREARRWSIDFQVQLQIPAAIKPSDYQLCSVLSNLIDNGMEACRELEESKRWLCIQARMNEPYLYICVENPCLPEHALRASREGHGLGLEIVKEIAQEYQGMVRAGLDGDRYRVEVVMEVR